MESISITICNYIHPICTLNFSPSTSQLKTKTNHHSCPPSISRFNPFSNRALVLPNYFSSETKSSKYKPAITTITLNSSSRTPVYIPLQHLFAALINSGNIHLQQLNCHLQLPISEIYHLLSILAISIHLSNSSSFVCSIDTQRTNSSE